MWISLAREGAYVLAFEGLREGMGNVGMYLLLEWKKRFGSLRISLLSGWNCMAQFSILSWSPICLPKHSIKLQCISVRRWGDISRPSTYPSRPEHEAFSKQNQASLT